MRSTNSNSSEQLSPIERLRYLWDLFKMRYRGRKSFDNSRNLARISEYSAISNSHGISLDKSQILEIGIGQRPYLGITFLGLGYNYIGIDLDQPVYPPSLSKFFNIYKSNGGLRMLKTLVRYFAFDRKEYSSLFQSLNLTPRQVRQSRVLIQANAADVSLDGILCHSAHQRVNSGLADVPLVVISESVFEHIPIIDLEQILANLREYAERSRRRVLVLTRPTVFTGICGSHLTEWYHHAVYSKAPKQSEPWEHLRKKRFFADTYLNRLSRSDYRALFSRLGFDLVNETVESPSLGSEFLSDQSLRQELADYSDEELLSNEVMFELKVANDR
jgi:hypothetical protein